MTVNETLGELLDTELAPPDFPGDIDSGSTLDEEVAALEAWRIDGERTALWAANKLARAERRRGEATDTARRLREMAAQHEQAVDQATEWDVRYFTGKLRQYHETQIAGTKSKTTKLPAGHTLKTTPGGVSTIVDEEHEAEVLAWCEDNLAAAVDYTVKLAKAKLKEHLDSKVGAEPGEYPAVVAETGELVPGVSFVRAEPRFVVVLAEPVTDPAE